MRAETLRCADAYPPADVLATLTEAEHVADDDGLKLFRRGEEPGAFFRQTDAAPARSKSGTPVLSSSRLIRRLIVE
jgi:hypothetical protein